MKIILQLKLARWANWLTSLSHFPYAELIYAFWYLLIAAALIYHAVEAFQAPLSHPVTDELRAAIRDLVNGDHDMVALSEIGRFLWQLLKAFGLAYWAGVIKHKWLFFFTGVTIAAKFIG